MALDVRFAFVCQKKFSDLSGHDEYKRYCDSCHLDVINLDALDDEARLKVFENAQSSAARLCVSATVPLSNSTPCIPSIIMPEMPPPNIVRLAGMPMMPDNLKEERERIEHQRTNSISPGKTSAEGWKSWLQKLKFW